MYKLPFKPGDDLWIIDEEHDCSVLREKNGIKGIAFMDDGEIKMVNKDGFCFSVGEENIFPTYEQACVRAMELLESD